MKIHEYQAKELLRKFGVNVPRGIFCPTVNDAVKATETLGGKVWVVKAQIHAGGRGKGGGVKVAKSPQQVREYAQQILGMQLVTHQTGPEGQKVRRLLVEEGADIRKEYYFAVLTDRRTQKVAVMASSEGGMDIEEVAHSTPEKIITVLVDPADGLTDAQARKLAAGIGVPAASRASAVRARSIAVSAPSEAAANPKPSVTVVFSAPNRIRTLHASLPTVGCGSVAPASRRSA